jgi:uncharacterized delta-60 repeat protein
MSIPAMRPHFRDLTSAWPLMISMILPALASAETGVQSWVQRYTGPNSLVHQAVIVALDSQDDVVVAGASRFRFGDYLTIKYSRWGSPQWTNQFNGSAECSDYTSAMVLDSQDNVIVTGSSIEFFSDYASYATVKYSSTGVPLWTNRYAEFMQDSQASAVAVDGNDDVLVTGRAYGSGSALDYATIKYSSQGMPLWTNRFNGLGNWTDVPYAMAVDGSNSVIVTGYSMSTSSSADYATIKYSSAGVPLWTNFYSGPAFATDIATSVAVDGGDNVIVTGFSAGSGGAMDFLTIKYSSSGAPLWTNRYDGPGGGNDYANAVLVDGNNEVVVTGHATNNATGYDYATIKYSSAGVPLWTNRYDGPAHGDDYARALARDASNNIFVTGYSTGIGSGYDYATIKYSSAGVPLWTNRYSGPGNSSDQALAVAVDQGNNVVVAGTSTNNISGYDLVTVKYVCVPAPKLTALNPVNGNFQLRVEDVLQPGTLVVEASSILAGWTPVFTNTAPTNVVYYTEPGTGNNAVRFYRAFQFP